jgi:hypothetical protein
MGRIFCIAGVILESYLMSAGEVYSTEDKYKVFCQMESELESRARTFGFRYILTKNYDALMRVQALNFSFIG